MPPRNRVLSFMSTWGSPAAPRSPEPDSDRSAPSLGPSQQNHLRKAPPPDLDLASSQGATQRLEGAMHDTPGSPTTQSKARGDLKPKRLSTMQAYNPPQVEVANDTPPELQPIFTYLNSHSNKLYQEGYFLKLHDLDSRGRPSQDRVWTECFAQLIGTVLSLWDAAALDVAGEDAEVVPTFVNLSDASVKMIESLPMNGAQGGNLQNVLSISTAANNRYLLHFNTLNSLTQWTAGIRLAMFEHSTLQEAYTGSLIAGKGRYLNNIKQIMFRLKFAHADWVRVRFGAGTPWQRCWCVISPPEEKSWEKAHKAAKKAGPYEKVKYPKGDIKFYDTRKVTKKTRPIASITDAYAVYAIYPQSKPLIEQSTLLKIEGLVTIHDGKEATTEGFVFVMPEVHQAVTGFEMMLRWLFPAFDAFALYGRPQKLIADTLDQRGLMFAMPNSRRYGYLDILDVSGLIHTKGSQSWSERQWRRELKKLTADRMMGQIEGGGVRESHESRRRNTTNNRLGVRFGNGEVAHSTPGSRSVSPAVQPEEENRLLPRTDSAPPTSNSWSPHKRSTSEAQGYQKYSAMRPDSPDGPPPPPPQHASPIGGALRAFSGNSLERINSGGASNAGMQGPPGAPPQFSAVAPVGPPPAFTHQPNSRPVNQPYAPPELRRANSNVDAATLAEMRDALSPQQYHSGEDEAWTGEVQQRQQNTVASPPLPADRNRGVPANRSEGVVNRMQSQPTRDRRQRLSTIPGSPFVGDGPEYFRTEGQTARTPRLDGVSEDPPSRLPPPPPPKDQPETPPVPLHATQSIARKPVPRILPPPPQPATDDRPAVIQRSLTDPTNAPMGDSFAHIIINEAALDQDMSPADQVNTLQTIPTQSTEPDYASTAASSRKKSMEQPRAGQVRTIGNSGMSATNVQPGQDPFRDFNGFYGPSSMLNADFGPADDRSRSIGNRPGGSTSRKPVAGHDRRRSRSADGLMKMSRDIGSNPAEKAAILAMGQPSQHSPSREALPENVFQGRSASMLQGRRKLTKEPPLSRNLSATNLPMGEWPPPSHVPAPQQQSSGRPPVSQPALFSAAAQREQDKAAGRDARNNTTVQQSVERQMQMQRQQQQQPPSWNQQGYMRSQTYDPSMQQQQRPAFQQSSSWQSGQRPPMSDAYTGAQYAVMGYRPQGSQQMYQQPYGSSYMAQQQQQQQYLPSQQQYGRR